MAKIKVKDTEVTILSIDEKDYISLTDMVRNIENGLSLIEKWLRNKNTIEFLGIWEEMYNSEHAKAGSEFKFYKIICHMPHVYRLFRYYYLSQI